MVCTLDQKLQRFSTETLRQHLLSVQGQNVHDGAVVVADNKTGEVLAYVGNVGALASARYVDGVQARRQAGSILKPFLYGLAFDKLLITPASLLDDAPLDVTAANGIYRPENYDQQFHGLVTARTALASSLNIPAVKLLNLTGVESFVQKLGDFGFERLQSHFYGPSRISDVTLWELINTYEPGMVAFGAHFG
jgi:penicillin-binding protein 1C